MDIEPPLLIQEAPNQNIVLQPRRELPDQSRVADPDRIARHPGKSEENAASGERLYKSGIIAKVDAENRALKVTGWKRNWRRQNWSWPNRMSWLNKARLEAGEISQPEFETAQVAGWRRHERSRIGAAKKEKAELDAAKLNLRRQQKLLAMGSGRKSEVNRAQEKVSALQQKIN